MDIASDIQQQITEASRSGRPLVITGNNSKAFYGRKIHGDPLHVSDHSGVLDYQPDELTITARAGTPLTDIIELLSEHRQMLPFEPPSFAGQASLGGCIATALAGPRRPWTGSVRDYVIGMRILNGEGKDLRFGGKVMKNVAGYDLFRPMVGALGTLGVMLEITLKLLPRPETETSFTVETTLPETQRLLHQWTYASFPLSAASYHDGRLHVRLSGARAAVESYSGKLPTERRELDSGYWQLLNEQQLDFFSSDLPLYKMVVPATAKPGELAADSLVDWGGALHWIKTDEPYSQVQAQAEHLGGSASCYRNGDREASVFPDLPANLFALHRRIKQVMDPANILNPGRLYRDL